MRIGVDCYPIQDPASAERGIGRYSRDLLRALLDHAPEDQFVLYLVNGMDDAGVPAAANVRIARVNPITRLNPFTDTSIAWHTNPNPDRLDAMLVLSPLQSHCSRVPTRIPRLISVFYDLIPEVLPNDYFDNPDYEAAHHGYIHALRRYDALLTMSRHARLDLCRRRGFDAEKITAVGSAASPHFGPALWKSEHLEDLEILRGLGVLEEGYVLNVGHEDPRKGSAVLVRAFAQLPESIRSTTRLVFAYNASEAHKAEVRSLGSTLGMPHAVGEPELLHELGMSPAIHFTGWCDDRALRALYRHAAVMVFPSLYEGFGLPLLEAMKCGCPVVAGDNSSQPEVVGEAGILVDAGDPEDVASGMRRVLGEWGLAAEMRRLGREQAGQFSWGETGRLALDAIRAAVLADRA